MVGKGLVTAQEAAETLGVSLATLYAYVSRGLIRSEEGDGDRRARRYHAEDVARLKQRKAQRRNPAQAAEQALYWGEPVVESQLTLIANGRLFYRGQETIRLARSHSVEAVAALLWLGEADEGLFAPLTPPDEGLTASGAGRAMIERFQLFLPAAAAADLAAYDLRPAMVAQTGARILQSLVALAAGGAGEPGEIAATLQTGWVPEEPRAQALLRAALILCADHELNISSFTARCVASAGSTPYAVVLAGLAALQGVKHGGVTRRVEAFLREMDTPEGVRAAIAGRLARGEELPGFGHPLYPEGDPRGRALLALLAEAMPETPLLELARVVEGEMLRVTGEYPTIDLGLVVLARALHLPPDGALTLFALGRTIGWIGHAIEQYQTDRLIRPRARYTGVRS